MLIPNIYVTIIMIFGLISGYLLALLKYNFPALDTLYFFMVFSFTIYCFLKTHSIHAISYLEGITVNLICYVLFIIPFLFINSISPLAPIWGAMISSAIFSLLWIFSKKAKVGILNNSPLSRFFKLGKIKAHNIKKPSDLKKINMLLYVSDNLKNPDYAALYLAAKKRGINTHNQKQVFEHYYGQQYDYSLTAHRTMSALQMSLYDIVKYSLFYILSFTLLILFIPVTITISAFILIMDGRPIVYAQNRTGLYGRPFKIYKFRTMKVESNPDGIQDPTRTGAFLRKTKLDEIPQLVNIIKGQMTLIGPRPEWDEITSDKTKVPGSDHLRSLILPGLTGWSQVNYRYTTNYKTRERKLRSDLYYINNRNFVMDVVILLRTVRVVLFGHQ